MNDSYEVFSDYSLCINIFRNNEPIYYFGAVLLEKKEFKHICAFYSFLKEINRLIRKKYILLDLETLFFTIYNEDKNNTDYENLSYLDNLDNLDNFFEILPAVLNTFREIKIRDCYIRELFTSIQMDLEKIRYNVKELDTYMVSSEELIGEIVFSIIYNNNKSFEMLDYIHSLCHAFQLTYFIKNIGKHFEMKHNRVYIPIEDQEEFNVSLELDIPKILNNTITENQFSNVKKLVKFEIDQANKYYEFSQIGIDRLDRLDRLERLDRLDNKESIFLTKELYSAIHKKIIENDYDVFTKEYNLTFYEKIKISFNILSWYNFFLLIFNYLRYSFYF